MGYFLGWHIQGKGELGGICNDNDFIQFNRKIPLGKVSNDLSFAADIGNYLQWGEGWVSNPVDWRIND